MTIDEQLSVLPYSAVVGQEEAKRALEAAFVAPRLGGVLLSGQRGTAKSTVARAFARMAYDELPVTLPINASDDRVVGGWQIDALMRGEPKFVPGLLEDAAGGMLYVDEVNLLDDHIVNLLLDVASTGVLSVQRDMVDHQVQRLSFTLVGTMNPEEGGLRPQLLDRFGLLIDVQSINDSGQRRKILDAVLRFDDARAADRPTRWLRSRLAEDRRRQEELLAARERVADVQLPEPIRRRCARLGEALQLTGHRGEYVTALTARALAALDGAAAVAPEHVRVAAPMALLHRARSAAEGEHTHWTDADQRALESVLGNG